MRGPSDWRVHRLFIVPDCLAGTVRRTSKSRGWRGSRHGMRHGSLKEGAGMKGRLTTLRRSAVAVGLSLSMVVAAGASAKAASPTVTLNNYTANAVSQSLHVALQLPDAVNQALQSLGSTLNGVVPGVGSALGNIDERISFASSTGQFTNAPKTILGKSLGQTFYGTLDGLISTVLQVPQTALAP